MVIATMIALPKPIYADTTCQPIYGGGQTCVSSAVSIEKDVVNPGTNNDVHDLGVNDPAFRAGDTVTFHITVRNTGSNTISNATVTDTFPSFLNFINGPGTFNTAKKTLTFTIGNLAPNQSQTFTVTGRIADVSQLPAVQPNCFTNQAVVITVDHQSAQDSSQFCVQPSISPTVTLAPPQVIQTPATGASSLLLTLLLPIGISGYFIQSFAKRSKK